MLQGRPTRGLPIFDQVAQRSKGQKRKEEDSFALINVGIMRYISPDVTTPIRGKTLPLNCVNKE